MCPELQDVALQDAQHEAAAPNSERNFFSTSAYWEVPLLGFMLQRPVVAHVNITNPSTL